MSEEQQKSAALGCMGLILILGVGSCMLGGGAEEPATPVDQAPITATNAVTEFPIDKEAREKKEKAAAKAQRAPRLVDLPPMDDVDRMIGAVINLNGHLCARPTLVQATGSPNLYAVQCITYRSGQGISNYLVNSQTNEVTEI